jgi:solute carrier family 8 (sodium/calcium exchanger)
MSGTNREVFCDVPKICEVGGRGAINLPWFGDDEQQWPDALRAPLYLIALAWCFLGVALIADVFMGAIEHITSKRVRKFNAKRGRYVTETVWNATVANLTLMALGSSAPEILLSIIELLGNDFYSGDLGPFTIVGSAAFNLFVIIAVCIMSIPDGELRSIKEMPVYFTTAIWSLFAYAWLLVILEGSSENVVEPWEGMLTLGFMPVLVTMAFMADKGYIFGQGEEQSEGSLMGVVARCMSKEELAQAVAKIKQKYETKDGKPLSESVLAKLIDHDYPQGQSRAHYRVSTIRAITGGKRVGSTKSASILSSSSTIGSAIVNEKRRSNKVAPGPDEQEKEGQVMDLAEEGDSKKTIIEFAALSYAVVENAGTREVFVERSGNLDKKVRVKFSTREGTAKAGLDYVDRSDELIFDPGVKFLPISLQIVDDTAFETDEEFYVDLREPEIIDADENASGADASGYSVELGEKPSVTVVIIDDDLPGQLRFKGDDKGDDHVTIKEGPEDFTVNLCVERNNGCTGKVTCEYKTEDASAQAGIDYEPMEGTLVFENGMIQQTIPCVIKGSGRYERKEFFRVVLSNVEGGATFDPECDGAKDNCCILSVFIECSGDRAKERVDHVWQKLQRKWEKSRLGHANWKDQFMGALYVNGAPPEENKSVNMDSVKVDSDGSSSPGMAPTQSENSEMLEQPSVVDYIMHFITIPWKLLFAFVPPTDYCGGWLSFVCSLLMIALVTAIIGDMAALLGCVLGIPDEVTAITFVALGTSLPDTFASRTAALQDPTADASVGNVTGSNSVNVFLGLGLPWTMGSLYWSFRDPDEQWIRKYAPVGLESLVPIPSQFHDGAFVVRKGALAPSVGVFTCCALAAMALLYLRRRQLGGELGGPKYNKILSAAFLVCLWVIFVCLCSYFALDQRLCK